MVFRRRNRRSSVQLLTESVYPRGGWRRAAQYVQHRLRRLPDEPHRIARGVFAGVFVSFTPFFGLHFLAAALLAWAMRGNILAALLATFVGNPLTTPLIAITSVELGHWMLGIEQPLDMQLIIRSFADAGGELWENVRALFTPETAHWDDLRLFLHVIYLPYLVGGILPGLVVSAGFYYATVPLIRAYQRLRAVKAEERQAKSARKRAAAAAAARRLPGGGL